MGKCLLCFTLPLQIAFFRLNKETQEVVLQLLTLAHNLASLHVYNEIRSEHSTKLGLYRAINCDIRSEHSTKLGLSRLIEYTASKLPKQCLAITVICMALITSGASTKHA
jgi:hypothetical protein